ncbi:MAG: hypothetical protein U0790_27340 [Isosphaeraceae bacterium]
MTPNNGRAEQQHHAGSRKTNRPAQATRVGTEKARLIERGARLFNHLVDRANRGESVGVGYAQFACCVHGAERFVEIFGRPYLPSDTKYVLDLAHRVTERAGQRSVVKNGVTRDVGMDTFIWRSEFPHERSSKAFSTPSAEETWKKVFPDGGRRLLKPDEISKIL